MNCEQIQNELLLYIGGYELPNDLREHLDSCSECRAFWTELSSVASGLGGDSDFYLDDAELESSVNRVDERIDSLELEKVIDVRSAWRSYVPAAAAVVLLVGMSLIIYTAGWLGGNGGQAVLPVEDSLLVTVGNGDIDVLNQTDFEYLLYQVSIDGRTATSGDLYDGITDQELEYLEQNFDVGEIL